MNFSYIHPTRDANIQRKISAELVCSSLVFLNRIKKAVGQPVLFEFFTCVIAMWNPSDCERLAADKQPSSYLSDTNVWCL